MKIRLVIVSAFAITLCPAVLQADNDQPPDGYQYLRTVLKAVIGNEDERPPSDNSRAAATNPGESIYSVSLEFDQSSWTDFFSKPDLFLVVEYEGGNRILVPEIEYNWDYSRKIYNIRCPTLPANSQCVLRLYDDDSASDAVWKQLATAKVPWSISGNASSGPAYQGIGTVRIQASANGEFQVLDPGTADTLMLDAPDPIAAAEFIVPPVSADKQWTLEGVFVKDSTAMGKVNVRHLYTNTGPAETVSAGSWKKWLLRGGIVVLVLSGLLGMLRRFGSSPSPPITPVPKSNQPLEKQP